MWRIVGAITAGTAVGAGLCLGLGYLWLCFGSSPSTDGLISF